MKEQGNQEKEKTFGELIDAVAGPIYYAAMKSLKKNQLQQPKVQDKLHKTVAEELYNQHGIRVHFEQNGRLVTVN